MQMQRRFKHTGRLKRTVIPEGHFSQEVREVAETLVPRLLKDCLLRRAQDNESAAHISAWLHSPGLKPPT